jgi:hypothetical protein
LKFLAGQIATCSVLIFVQLAKPKENRLDRLQNKMKSCHSERSEESLFDSSIREQNQERFFAALRMTAF